MSHIRRAIVWLSESPVTIRVAGCVNTWLRPPRPLPIRVAGHKIYAQSLDRIVALLLHKFSSDDAVDRACLRRILRPGMVVADVGANLGVFTFTAAEAVGPTGRVHTFEPDPENFALLCRSIKASGFQNIVPHQVAITDYTGEGRLYFRAENRGDHRIYVAGTDERPSTAVLMSRLDDALGSDMRLDVVKFDIQGAEWRAVAGMTRLLELNPELKIITEFWPDGISASGGDPAAFLDFFEQRGFGIRLIEEQDFEAPPLPIKDVIAYANRASYVNLFLSPAAPVAK